MYTCQSIRPDLYFNISSHSIASIQASIFSWLVTDLKKIVDLRLIHTHTTSNLSQALVRRIPRFIDYIDIEKVLLLLKQLFGKVVELGGVDLLHSVAGFMSKS